MRGHLSMNEQGLSLSHFEPARSHTFLQAMPELNRSYIRRV